MTPLKIAAGVCLAVAIFAAGYMANRTSAPATAAGSAGHVEYYSCPMHPQYRSDHPGDCPSCGMRLTPVKTDGEAPAASSGAAGMPGAVAIGEEGQRLIGVRTAPVRMESVTSALRVPGRVAIDDSRLYRIVAAADGWVRELGDNPAGTFVKKNQVLANYFVRDLLSSQQNYLYVQQVYAQTAQAQSNTVTLRNQSSLNYKQALDALHSLGMTDEQIKELEHTRDPRSTMDARSPADGFVVARNITFDQRFDKGAELYNIADIRHVWVVADIFEKDRDFLKPGVAAVVRYRGHEFHARMSDALPQFDAQSRTLKTRFELDNPGFLLRPDMFVDLEVRIQTPPAISVPADAIIDSGRHKTVYIAKGGGLFEPRLIQTGWRLGDRVQVVAGLQPDENIVVSSNFLIDSESRMKWGSAATPAAAPEMPASSMAQHAPKMERTAAGKSSSMQHAGMEMPADAPSGESAMAPAGEAMSHDGMASAGPVKDPVCGMNIDPNAATTLKTKHAGKTYYFCSDNCKKSFEANPSKYVPQAMSMQGAAGKRGPA